jgi:histidine triad (HIT) family protein
MSQTAPTRQENSGTRTAGDWRDWVCRDCRNLRHLSPKLNLLCGDGYRQNGNVESNLPTIVGFYRQWALLVNDVGIAHPTIILKNVIGLILALPSTRIPMTAPNDSIFGKIIRREIPADIVYEDDFCLACRDVAPQAPVHILLIPKNLIISLASTEPEDHRVLGHMMLKVRLIAEQEGLTNGYRVVTNIGADGGQTVHHLHFHILGGRSLSWPPG